MKCRRCDREIPGDSKRCDYCGTFQQAYVQFNDSRYNYSGSKKVVMNAVVFIVLAVIIIAVVIASFFLTEGNRKKHLEQIRELYELLSAEPGEHQAELDIFNARVGQYVVKYPKSEEVEEVEKYHAEINGYDPELSGPHQENKTGDSLEQEKYLIENARNTIIRIAGISSEKRVDSDAFDLIISWSNNSKRVVGSVVFLVDAYDPNGGKIEISEGKTRLSASTKTGPFNPSAPDSSYQNVWINAWPPGSEISSVELAQVTIYYEDGSSIVLNDKITPHLK